MTEKQRQRRGRTPRQNASSASIRHRSAISSARRTGGHARVGTRKTRHSSGSRHRRPRAPLPSQSMRRAKRPAWGGRLRRSAAPSIRCGSSNSGSAGRGAGSSVGYLLNHSSNERRVPATRWLSGRDGHSTTPAVVPGAVHWPEPGLSTTRCSSISYTTQSREKFGAVGYAGARTGTRESR